MHISFHYPEVGLSIFVNGVMSSNTLMSGIGCIINYELDLKLSGDPLIHIIFDVQTRPQKYLIGFGDCCPSLGQIPTSQSNHI